ncbi:hypothetical protein VOLCADRAFT_103989 [Volvox carteri f. nagariensis]|uniref:Glycosyl transferase CAP10 domain-containing protein n=1 Tax=Volvox carteri f. nagariensis TaxID=3068 RepID=D8TQI4_VOLCA|nr:uncharacterized protein VOLCADRAFT_103989 [Volvox carteri f. nagariensis]EFJ50159.1 hypothetical protein VOLCADRAFT_103989 [Volvox carteri f. nagariensis]|eukprot:XP_002948779.1 hypothetical protein VOLCADRAFT_103989 [Volvox carteri f. nagariensis]
MFLGRLFVALLLLATTPQTLAILHTELFNSSINDPLVTLRNECPGAQRATTEADLEPLLRDNLEPDLRPWRQLGRPLTRLDLLNFLHEIDSHWLEYRRNFLAVVVIRNNVMRWWAYPNARGWCTRRVKFIAEQFHGFVASVGLRFPDVVYVMNAYDKPLCERGNCSAPLFTFDKRWNASAYAAGLPGSAHDDILHPVMNHPFEQLIDYPWDKKIERGFMRVGIYGAMAANCSRVLMYKVAQSRAGQEVLDVGIYQNRHWKVKVKTVPPVPMELHTRWKYLINTDGQSASWRLAKLLAMNSAVLKYRSDAIEYYYRSLREGENYVSFDHTDVVEVIKGLKGRDAELKTMAARNQAFAFRYLSQLSRTLYAKVSFERYKGLFSDMDEFLHEIPQDFSMSWFLQHRARLIAASTGVGLGSMPPGMLRGTHWVQGLWAIYLGISGPLLALVLGQHAALAAAAFWTTADQVPSRLQETKMSGRPEPVPELADSAMESSAAMGTEAVETAAAAAPVGVGGGPAATPSSATPTPPSLPAAIVLEMMDRELRPVPAATQPYVTATSTTITAANGSTSGGGPRPSPPSSLPSRLRSSAALVLRPDVLVDLAAAASLLTLTGVSLAYVYLDRESAAASRGYRRYWWFSILLGPSGCFLRWYLSHLNGWRDGWLQYGTFAANVLGCALVFACEALLFRLEGSLGEVQRMALQGLMVGTAGCLTTVSTYVVEIQKLALSSLPAAYKYFLTSTLVPVALGLLVYGVPREALRYMAGRQSMAIAMVQLTYDDPLYQGPSMKRLTDGATITSPPPPA